MSKSFLQNDKSLSVNFANLGPSDLLLESFSGVEKLSEAFHFELDMLAEMETEIPFAKILGQSATVRMTGPSGTTRFFNGIIRQLIEGDLVGSVDGSQTFIRYRAVVVPRVSNLQLQRRCRIFQEATVLSILQTVFTGYDVNFAGLVESFPARNYCVQYEESDFEFACRLMREEGFYYYFQHTENSHSMVVLSGRPTTKSLQVPYDPNGRTPGIESIRRLTKQQSTTPGSFTAWDYHFQSPTTNPTATRQVCAAVEVGNVSHAFTAGGNSTLVDFQPAHCAQHFDTVSQQGSSNVQALKDFGSKVSNRATLAMERTVAEALTLEGDCECPLFSAGTLVTVPNHFRGAIDMLLTEVRHQASVEGAFTSGTRPPLLVRNQFQAIPASLPYRPQPARDKPKIHGYQTAMVISSEGADVTTDPYGRVQVQFYWDVMGNNSSTGADGNSSVLYKYWEKRPSGAISNSCWLRVAQQWAGNGMGSQFTPRKGMEVIVAFADGDPDCPLIVGCVYNALNKPPFELPASASTSGWKTASLGGDSTQFSGVALIDTPGQEVFQIQSERNLIIRTEGDLIFDVGGNILQNTCGKIRTAQGNCTAGTGSSGGGGGSGDTSSYGFTGINPAVKTWDIPANVGTYVFPVIDATVGPFFSSMMTVSNGTTTTAHNGTAITLTSGTDVEIVVDFFQMNRVKSAIAMVPGVGSFMSGGSTGHRTINLCNSSEFTFGTADEIYMNNVNIIELGSPTLAEVNPELYTLKNSLSSWCQVFAAALESEVYLMSDASELLNLAGIPEVANSAEDILGGSVYPELFLFKNRLSTVVKQFLATNGAEAMAAQAKSCIGPGLLAKGAALTVISELLAASATAISQGSAFYMKSAPQTAKLRSAPGLHEQVNVLSMAVEASAAIILTATGTQESTFNSSLSVLPEQAMLDYTMTGDASVCAKVLVSPGFAGLGTGLMIQAAPPEVAGCGNVQIVTGTGVFINYFSPDGYYTITLNDTGIEIEGPQGQSIVMNADGITLEGPVITIAGTTSVNIEAPNVTINGTTAIAIESAGDVTMQGDVSVLVSSGDSGVAMTAEETAIIGAVVTLNS